MEPLDLILARPDLNDRAKLVLIALHHRPPACSEELAPATGHSPRKTQRTLRELVASSLVEAHAQSRHRAYQRRTNTPHYHGTLWRAEVGDGLE